MKKEIGMEAFAKICSECEEKCKQKSIIKVCVCSFYHPIKKKKKKEALE
jgi:hypothetical protein